MASSKKKKQPKVIAVSARTGKEIKKPRKGQSVLYAVKGVRGGIKVIRKEPQEFYKTDLLGLNKIVDKSEKENFVIYEQKLRYPERYKSGKKKGKIIYRTDAEGIEKKLYQTKITFAKPRAFTKPLLYKGGKKLRALDLAFKEGNYKNKKMVRDLILVKPSAKIIKQTLTGPTIKAALSNIQLDVNMKKVRRKGFGVFYNIYVLLTAPDGTQTKVPMSGKYIDAEFSGTNRIPVDGKMELFGRSKVKIIANMQSAMAHSIRYALKNTGQGYAFTTLTTLEKLEKRIWKKVTKAERQGDIDRADALAESVKNLYFGHKKKFFINPKTKLQSLNKGYKVTMYVQFEVME